MLIHSQTLARTARRIIIPQAWVANLCPKGGWFSITRSAPCMLVRAGSVRSSRYKPLVENMPMYHGFLDNSNSFAREQCHIQHCKVPYHTSMSESGVGLSTIQFLRKYSLSALDKF
jgi:hypothetical protein